MNKVFIHLYTNTSVICTTMSHTAVHYTSVICTATPHTAVHYNSAICTATRMILTQWCSTTVSSAQQCLTQRCSTTVSSAAFLIMMNSTIRCMMSQPSSNNASNLLLASTTRCRQFARHVQTIRTSGTDKSHVTYRQFAYHV